MNDQQRPRTPDAVVPVAAVPDAAPASRAFDGTWDLVAEFLARQGVDTVFGLPGDDVLVVSAFERAGIRLVWCRDQRLAVHMASGYAVTSGRTGVCVVGKGPAVANAVGGLLEAATGCSPVLLLAGGTAVESEGARTFQDAPALALAAPVTKWAGRVTHPDRLLPALRRAAALVREAPRGPVFLEIPDGFLEQRFEVVEHLLDSRPPLPARYTAPEPPAEVSGAKRPVVLAGGGLRGARVPGAAERLAEALGAALLVTASGRGSVAESHPLFCGLAGLYAQPPVRTLLDDCDLVVTLGSRLEETATEGLPQGVPVCQVNVDADEFSYDWPGPLVHGDAAATAHHWADALGTGAAGAGRETGPTRPADGGWTCRITAVRRDLEAWAALPAHPELPDDQVRVKAVVREISRALPERAVVVHENGLMDIWSYLYPVLRLPAGTRSVVPSEQTTLGYGAAAAAGAKLAAPEAPVVAIVGDGAFDLLRVELPTLLRERIGLTYVILDNGGYGWLQRMVDNLDGPPHLFTADDPARPEFDGGVLTWTVAKPADTAEALRAAMSAAAEGRVAVVRVRCSADDWPPVTGVASDEEIRACAAPAGPR
ncbi:thiamine pyrophosphate-binding protein [Streptomyces ficellus]|uniref:Thiamine pyrophosphate-binding protein n=1 Tax=Streptomyces ficellus TaxID=1977088 RepID=A0ABT7Z3M5_9ACTN|nr:thiamine pyrophosphate-binding protein [Streptomyces ficellus]MDN3294088.1 thiamine pyrophosphate-binding protein [Streptomyces ficellus]